MGMEKDIQDADLQNALKTSRMLEDWDARKASEGWESFSSFPKQNPGLIVTTRIQVQGFGTGFPDA
jgi:hypothetical protein